MISVRVNEKSLSSKFELTKEIVGEKVEQRLLNVAETLVEASPVDTGAFVTSWSAVPSGSGGGRSRTSRGKPSLLDSQKSQKRDEAYSLMAGDLERIDLWNTSAIVFRNRAPHAAVVGRRHLPTQKAYDKSFTTYSGPIRRQVL